MKKIHVGNFKRDFSSIIKRVLKSGEKFVIVFGKKQKKVAMLVPYEDNVAPRKFGQFEGQLKIDDNFDDEMTEINEMFYGKNQG